MQYMTQGEADAVDALLPGNQAYGVGSRLKASLDAAVLGFATRWYVDGAAATANGRKSKGSDENDGLSKETPFRTMAKVFTKIKSGDIIFVYGKLTEQIIAPLGVFDVTIIGCGNRPRHDGAHWAPLATATATPNLVLREQGWSIFNILFDAPDAAAAIQIRRDEDATYPDGSHATIEGCLFLSGGTGIEDVGGMHNCVIRGNRFEDLTNGIKTVSAGIAVPLQNTIEGNDFDGCENEISISGSRCIIRGNSFAGLNSAGSDNTMIINTKAVSSQGGKNLVYGNYINVATAIFAAGLRLVGATGDMWNDNYNSDTAAVEVGIPAP
jgi:hypothetical protein